MMKLNQGIHFNSQTAQLRVWAPFAKQVACRVFNKNLEIPLTQAGFGYWEAATDKISVGDTYKWLVDGKELPDPASLSQPEGVHGVSEAVDLSEFDWNDGTYKVPELKDFIIYELHTGTFTDGGTFDAIAEKILYLKKLGITAIEIMPVAQFPGDRNWGYDGVFPFAVQHSYGGYRGLQRLVNQCHQNGLAVILDVVYNHLGPEGNYFGAFGPYFTDKYHTPWGNAINFDDAWSHGMRGLLIQNMLMWFKDFHIDALRLDAVHAIKDFSSTPILQEMRLQLDEWERQSGKRHYLIAECDLNDRRFLESPEQNGLGMHAQWIDEFHHALRVTAGEARKGYYKDFEGIESLAKAYKEAYVFNGNYSTHRQQFFGSRTDGLEGQQFVVFSQNHDQTGNRMLGERSSHLYDFEMQKLMAFAVMVSPYVPLIFMGEEWACAQPFQYFISHSDRDLIEAVRKGRKSEFADFHAERSVPDPQSEETFESCKLKWKEQQKGQHATMLDYYSSLIHWRKSDAILCALERGRLEADADEARHLLLLKRHGKTKILNIVMNFSNREQQVALSENLSEVALVFDTSAKVFDGPGVSSQNKHLIIPPHAGVAYY